MSEIIIQDLFFPYTPRYAGGHVCSDVEARALEGVRIESLRNRFAPTIKAVRAIQPVTPDSDQHHQLRQDFLALEQTHTINAHHIADSRDPITKLARHLARLAIQNKLRQQGKDPDSFQPDWYKGQIDFQIEKEPFFREEAKRRTEAKQRAAQIVMSGLEG